ncbi:MAG: tetratricopeptide repeat protein [Microcoleus sp. PH2017_10_PVI_O_A]|uniref:CHAT domain-containing tetratricopeptide repeat protein n=1 Tax=unclassified Microcoleus TaxID=2642155 RepID=UPI001DAE1BE9|nr:MULTISPECIES: tetratricopeptide repeat protein [unclassified Microcoleus]TAE85320.1 MAG: CHAT domain-containing protein [Oscillatoriales cyanobacterium]MCC3404732.1 tetratricopeptide repeat protein [Microcoleus sp. PH2017_10_PVI_O_A]MCC3458801.1 tetratricopeptide repeat protein [Microcoleus sp. PH2017_11_PCY_U_A]MCC3476998.1 tetratricopeptide repeat protein [Microcoleus sp. PH2017_12_PCY_D_A]MCC3558198.1 tetratricopeptide repeat protein [Microcoleus sp. PH2017_27_LUM_O_A]
MAENSLRINHDADSIQLFWQRGNSAPRVAPPATFEHPFDSKVLADLRWYLEEYLRFPYGLEPENAKKIEQKLQAWGQQLFDLVFRSSEKAREFFQEATRAGLDKCEISIISDDAAVLNLPWELLFSPDYQFLAPLLAGMYRSLSNYAVRAELGAMSDEQLNILLVIARPYGERDINFQTIARPMLEALKPIQKQVNLTVLRPPSLKQFEAELNARKGFYHIVHFDGHGDFQADSKIVQTQYGKLGEGVLVFEDNDGNPEIVTAREIAQYLNDCRVPVFVLNACKSGEAGEEPFSSVAGQLVKLGAKGVVAMAYSVYATGAKHFMGRLYGELVRGQDIASAVAAGRKSMSIENQRPSPKGLLPLQDWLVPVLYQQEPCRPFRPTTATPSFADLMEEADNSSAIASALLVNLPDVSAYGFIGRDYDILCLERAFRQNYIVLLQGMGGVGKTELVGGFARWLVDTQGRKGGVFFTSFESGAGFSQVVNQIGRKLGGEKFASLPSEKQQDVVRQYLQTNPCLLIWDNFEPVNGFPQGNQPLLPAAERDSLKQFLKELRGGQSWVLITSRREENWLDCGYALRELKGLVKPDAEELAAEILKQAGVDRAKLPGEYLELLKLLDGHPLSLRVVLRHLKTQSPVQLIEALRRGLDTFKGAEEEGRDKSLMVSLDYSFANLSERARQHLPFLGLFCDRVDADWLHAFSRNPDIDWGQAYRTVFGENLQKADWIALLNEATAAGILEDLGGNIYKIHPALPWYLRQQLDKMGSQEVISNLEKKLLVFYVLLADQCNRELIGNAELATFVLRVEEPNLLQHLRLAEQQQDWGNAYRILFALGEVYQRWGRKPEFKSLRVRALNQIGIHLAQAKAKGQDAFNFWRYLRGIDANEATQSADWETARAVYQEILDELTALNDSSVNDNIATINHNLGIVAQEQRRFDDAIAFYNKSLQIREDAGDLYMAAGDYHQLGIVAEEQRRFDDAIAFYNKSLQIREDAGDLYNAAGDYHQLGIVAQLQRRFDDAIAFYNKALQIYEDAGDFYNAAGDYHQLGRVAEEQRRFDDAIAFYNKALQIYEDAGDSHKAANQYEGLGNIAKEQGDFDTAVAYFQKAFTALSAANDWRQASLTLTAWGQTLEAESNWTEAVKIYIQALVIDIEHNEEFVVSDIHNLGRMLKQLGDSQFKIIWREFTGNECPENWFSAIQEASETEEEGAD